MDNQTTGALALIFGVIILLGSIITFIAASSTVNNYETDIGQVKRSLDPDAQDEYRRALGWQACSGIGIVIGGILSFVGAYLYFRQEPQRQRPQPYHPPPAQPYYPPPQQPPPYQPPPPY